MIWEEDSIYPQIRASVVSELVAHLEQRIALLQEGEDTEPVLVELRCQMAESAVRGRVGAVAALEERMLRLLYAKEHAGRLV